VRVRDAWYTAEADALVPADKKCSHCKGATFKKEMDILDVWFESGSSYLALRSAEPEYGRLQICILKAEISTGDGSTLRCCARSVCRGMRLTAT